MNEKEYEFAVRSYAALRTFLEPGSPLEGENQELVREILVKAPDSISVPGDQLFELAWNDA